MALVIDGTPASLLRALPRNFRVVLPSMRGANSRSARTIAGCGAFSAAQLANARARILATPSASCTTTATATATAEAAAPLIVVDARRESHAHLNGAPISWFAAPFNDEHARARRDDCAISRITAARVAALGAAAQLEQRVVEAEHNATYVALPVDDHRFPQAATVDAFVRMHDEGKLAGADVLYHCRAGRGRTTLFLVLHELLMLGRDGGTPRQKLEQIVAKHARVGGKNLLAAPSLCQAVGRRQCWAAERALFVCAFADYVAARYQPSSASLQHPCNSWAAFLASAMPTARALTSTAQQL